MKSTRLVALYLLPYSVALRDDGAAKTSQQAVEVERSPTDDAVEDMLPEPTAEENDLPRQDAVEDMPPLVTAEDSAESSDIALSTREGDETEAGGIEQHHEDIQQHANEQLDAHPEPEPTAFDHVDVPSEPDEMAIPERLMLAGPECPAAPIEDFRGLKDLIDASHRPFQALLVAKIKFLQACICAKPPADIKHAGKEFCERLSSQPGYVPDDFRNAAFTEWQTQLEKAQQLIKYYLFLFV